MSVRSATPLAEERADVGGGSSEFVVAGGGAGTAPARAGFVASTYLPIERAYAGRSRGCSSSSYGFSAP